MSAPDLTRWAEPAYVDASALVKLFVPEPESDDLNQALAGLTDVIVSDLALTEMASALVETMRNPARGGEMAERGREVIDAHYDWGRLADRLEQIWLGVGCER